MRHTAARLATILLAATTFGCATTRDMGRPLVPSRFQTRTGPFVVFTNDPIAADAPVVRQLQALETEFEKTLDAGVGKVDPPIEVYLLADRKSFEHFLTFYYPDLPQRRAFFLSQGDRRVIYTFVGDHVAVDVRHEATHALLSVAFGELPLWLDEGLAEYFETPGGDGDNPENLRRYAVDVSENREPNLARLEGLRTIKQMTPRDYRESWAWCHFLLSGTPEGAELIKSYLRSSEADRGTLSDRVAKAFPDADRRLETYVETLASKPAGTVSPPNRATVRLQDEGEAVSMAPPRPKSKRGVLGRFRDFVFGRSDEGF